MQELRNRERAMIAITLFSALLAALLLLIFSPASVNATIIISNGMSASLVLGQPNFSSFASGTSQTSLNTPNGVAIDPTTGKVFVSDGYNNRVLRFASVAALSNGAAAEGVLGQSDFVTNTFGTTQSKMNFPTGIDLDSSGRLWVADYGNQRVLRFDNASSKPNGANADAVLGQINFISNTSATTQSGMNSPTDVFPDTSGRLWVVDYGNHRVLRFDNAAAKPNGANADAVLGQDNFTSGSPNKGGATSQSGMRFPSGLAVDSSGRLWVGDQYNHRVLRFDNAAAKSNGANFDGLLGQTNSTSNTGATTQSGMKNPTGVTLDSTGRLYVSDSANNRILTFNNAASKANGANADNVLGQTNFTTDTGGVSASTLFLPAGVFFDPATEVLWAVDEVNNRVLMYGTPTFKLYLPLTLK